MRQSVTFVNGNSVRNTVTRIQNNTSGTAGSIQWQHSLNGNVEGGHVESFKHDLGHLFTVGFRVQRGFGAENRVFFRGNTQLIVEGVMPNLLHVVPVGDDTVFDWVLQSQNTSLRLRFIANIRILLAHADHDTLMTGTSNNRWENLYDLAKE